MKNTTDEIVSLIKKGIKEITDIKKTPKVLESNDYGLLLHKKEIYKRMLRILDGMNILKIVQNKLGYMEYYK